MKRMGERDIAAPGERERDAAAPGERQRDAADDNATINYKKGRDRCHAGAAHRRHRVPERESKRILAASQKRRGKENKSERERENGNKRERKQQSTILRIEKREMEERTGERVSFPFVLILPPQYSCYFV